MLLVKPHVSEMFFENNIADYDERNQSRFLSPDESDFSNQFKADIRSKCKIYMERFYEDREQKYAVDGEKNGDELDMTVYTGMSGEALVYLKVAVEQQNREEDEDEEDEEEEEEERELDTKATERVKWCASNREFVKLRSRKPSFVSGPPGPLAILIQASVPGGQINLPSTVNKKLVNYCMEELLGYLPIALASTTTEDNISDELLFGRTGYLYSLMYVYQCHDALPDQLTQRLTDAAKQICRKIIESGMKYSRQNQCSAPLWWQWHEKEYLGIAHGVGGILYMLLGAKRFGFIDTETVKSLVKPTLDYLASLQFKSGNFPSSKSPKMGDRLVQWCHGAPGIIHLLLQAYDLFGDETYLARARSCGSAVWRRGLLKKSYGLCHGTSGNAYAFLHLWRVTRDPKYLHQAAVFISWCFGYDEREVRVPDRPFSLFEGIGGVIYLFTDVLQGLEQARFPAFEL